MSERKPARKVKIKKTLTRVDSKDTVFLETMELGGVTLNIQIRTLQPINWFDEGEFRTIFQALFASQEQVEVIKKDYFEIKLFSGDQEILLELKEWIFFASMTIMYLSGFMNRPEVRRLDKLTVDLSRSGRIDVLSAQELVSEQFYTLLEEEIKMLESPKFGCRFHN